MLNQRVDDHVGGAGIKSKHLIHRAVCRQDRYIADAAQVLQRARLFAAVKQVLSVGNQRRSAAAGCHIHRPEAGYHLHPGFVGDDGRFPDLQGRGNKIPVVFRDVVDRLAMGADHVHLADIHACLFTHGLGSPGEPIAQLGV